jgi:microcystin-dependent protein
MADPFLGEIRMFGGNYAPLHWSLCNGTLLAISQQQTLFSLLGNAYGGDGRTSFALPDMRGRLPVHQGQGPGLTPRVRGQMYGVEEVTLTSNEIPSHTHPIQVAAQNGSASSPAGAVLSKGADGDKLYMAPGSGDTINEFADAAVATTGNGLGHNNQMPALCVSFIISMLGIYPSRN